MAHDFEGAMPSTPSHDSHGSQPDLFAESLNRDEALSTLPSYRWPTEARLKYFWDYVTSHANLTHLHTIMTDAIRDPHDARLILLYGPTRVGKTTLLKRIERDHETRRLEAQSAGDWNPGHIPLLRFNIPATGEKAVTFSQIYMGLLQAAHEPLIHQKRAWNQAQTWKPSAGIRPAQEQDLHWAVKSMIQHRQPAVILLDEAQHVSVRRSNDAINAQLDCFKSLADETGIPWILAGSYELFSYQNRNAQLSSRSHHLHFPRYHIELDADVEEFKRVIGRLSQRLPLQEPANLEKQWEYLYRFSGGIIGIVKTWLYKALKRAIQENATTVTKEHLEFSTYEAGQILSMIAQAIDGETKLAEDASQETLDTIDMKTGYTAFLERRKSHKRRGSRAVRGSLPASAQMASEGRAAAPLHTSGASALPNSPNPVTEESGEHGTDETTAVRAHATNTRQSTRQPTTQPTTKGAKTKKPVGQRKPTRDPTGLAYDDTLRSPYRI